MHHKRGKPKSSRAGCLLCKSHKHQRAKDKRMSQRASVRRQLQESVEARALDT